MIILVLSYFDPIVGPRIFLKAPESVKDVDLDVIASMMDVYEDKFFIHISGNIKSASLIFEIPNLYSRGNRELFQISIVIDINSEINLNLARDLLEGFVNEFKKIEDVYKALYVDSKKYDGATEKFEEVKNLFFNFYKSFKPAVEALEKAELRYRSLFKAARDAIFIINKNSGEIVDANKKAEKILECPRKEIIGLNAFNLYYSEDFRNIREQILNLIDLEDALPIEAHIRNSKEKFVPVEINASEIEIGGQYYIQAILRDITERKLSEQKLIQSEENYRKAYDRADFYKDLFAYDMNYILRNINSSSDFLSLIFKSPKIKGDKNELIQSIKEQALRGLNLILYVQKILDIDDTDLSMERLEINIVLNEAITFVTNNFHERLLKIKIETPGAGLWVKTNELLLEVFESILINAAENNDKPFVSMKIRISKEKKEDIKYFKLEFLDNGMGIPDNIKEKIFLKGYREEESISGMGLGLYLVKRIVQSFKGMIWVEDRIKGDHTKGSNVIVLIPEA